MITQERTSEMLVLSRKIMESIMIGDNIRVTVVRIRGGKISIGIDAPAEYKITRSGMDDDKGSSVGGKDCSGIREA